jgi:UDP-2-acetamido-3-amino-2,3-dideoxy-glucuronate N-acetyltransferase
LDASPKVAVLGAGHWGRNLARNFADLGALAAVFDVDRAAAVAQTEGRPGVVAAGDIGAVLDDPEIDAVAIATPAESHAELARAALAAGKHVFVEKPMCLDIADGNSLIGQAQAAGLTLMVGHLLRYHPAFRALLAAVRAGAIGRLQYIYSNRLSLGRIRISENALWSFAPHDISMILALTGEMPSRVSTNGGSFLSPGIADTTVSYLKFANGVEGHIFVSWLHPFKDHRLVVIGDAGMISFDDSVVGPDKLLLYRHELAFEGPLPAFAKARPEAIAFGPEEPLAVECRHFLDCVAQGRTPDTDGAEGLAVLKVLDACQRSLASGNPQSVDSEEGR